MVEQVLRISRLLKAKRGCARKKTSRTSARIVADTGPNSVIRRGRVHHLKAGKTPDEDYCKKVLLRWCWEDTTLSYQERMRKFVLHSLSIVRAAVYEEKNSFAYALAIDTGGKISYRVVTFNMSQTLFPLQNTRSDFQNIIDMQALEWNIRKNDHGRGWCRSYEEYVASKMTYEDGDQRVPFLDPMALARIRTKPARRGGVEQTTLTLRTAAPRGGEYENSPIVCKLAADLIHSPTLHIKTREKIEDGSRIGKLHCGEA